MINRVALYYGFLLPLLIINYFGPPLFRDLFLMFFILMTIRLPYSDEFIDWSVKKFLPFLLVTLLIIATGSLIIDIIDILYNFNSNFLFLLIVPLYLIFKILTFPWLFDKFGIKSVRVAFTKENENNWLILAAITFLLIANQIPYLVFFLAAPMSYIVADNLEI